LSRRHENGKMTGREIRTYFLTFFEKRGHTIVPSSSLVPKEDPTLLFTNAGMVQFKKTFLGEEKRDYVRAASSQKCVRAGGKHNDLENVGKTARHHTFFEMLGNFSFGDYFKSDAIDFAWELLVKEWGLPSDRLWVTIHEGDPKINLGPDKEAGGFWERYLPEGRIVPCPTKDNFWQMGDTGPCGPCSEIVIDQGAKVGCGEPTCRVGCDCDRYLELWNLVFMQYNRDDRGNMNPLPKPSIDTGMGLERIAAVLQGKLNNFDTDLFTPIIHFMEEVSARGYGEDSQIDISMRVIADHARSVTFLIGDGVVPSNEGRGYVLRRIIRRAARHGKLLGLNEPFLHRACRVIVDDMKDAFPELSQRAEAVDQIIQREEERFAETLEKGLRILGEEKDRLREDRQRVLPGDVVFRLYDTYGFPVDLTADVAREDGFEIDEHGFNLAMEEQRRRARSAWVGSGEEEVPEIYRRLAGRSIYSEFIGYEELSAISEISALLADGQDVTSADPGARVGVVTPRTPFYGESGGQVGDQGLILGPGVRFEVEETIKPLPELIIHLGELKEGTLRVGQEVELRVAEGLRLDTARNHSATHLLQAVLRQVLGEVVHQSGSKVTPDELRFDYTYPSPVNLQQIEQVERRVNERIRENHEVRTQFLSYQDALAQGAIALFDEKYGHTVRVVQMGDFSMELCGGCHIHRTGDVGYFKILSDRSISADTRRIEALTGRSAVECNQERERMTRELAARLKATPDELLEKAQRLQDRIRDLEREVRALQGKLAAGKSRDLLEETLQVGDVRVLAAEVEVGDQKALGDLSDRLRDRLESGIVLLGAQTGSRVILAASVSKDLQETFPAGQLVGEVAKIVGGKGGGRAHFAQGGGPLVQKLQEALEHAYRMIEMLAKES
jgi:alanyl-tRNA synthetase